MAIIDTSAVIDAAKGNKSAIRVLKAIEDRGEPLKISSATVFELFAGAPKGAERKGSEIAEPFQVVPFFFEHAKTAAEIYRELRDRGEDIGQFDSMIAAVALREKETLVTANSRHFKRVRGLELETY